VVRGMPGFLQDLSYNVNIVFFFSFVNLIVHH
jgi:hypothetical protein